MNEFEKAQSAKILACYGIDTSINKPTEDLKIEVLNVEDVEKSGDDADIKID